MPPSLILCSLQEKLCSIRSSGTCNGCRAKLRQEIFFFACTLIFCNGVWRLNWILECFDLACIDEARHSQPNDGVRAWARHWKHVRTDVWLVTNQDLMAMKQHSSTSLSLSLSLSLIGSSWNQLSNHLCLKKCSG
jgi:hypothetical protein